MTVINIPNGFKDFCRLKLQGKNRPWIVAPKGCNNDAFRSKVNHAVTSLSGEDQHDELLKIYKEFYPELWAAEKKAEEQKKKDGQEKSKQKKAAAAADAASSTFSASRATDDSDDTFQVMDL